MPYRSGKTSWAIVEMGIQPTDRKLCLSQALVLRKAKISANLRSAVPDVLTEAHSNLMGRLRLMKTTIISILVLLMLVGCTDQKQEAKQDIDMPRFSDVDLAKGRSHWMATCRNCHLLGTSGAPAVTDNTAWDPRIAKGKEALYRSALNGIRDLNGAFLMPPRGGNPRLSDEQVRLAVDYMVSSVEYLYRQQLDRQ